ncbi:uncharacterized protein LOC113202495 isoform X1 [Frankliniella occidentalis]|uniref:Uncharacterized protein LOC113202495 isoform X1 n=1 Tax=Frankliniella occidentalis TaxID=133901 RepID=A0A9C6XCE7_FRAOC|nr:uncharacterized protein LOC113202495 isoform X1 [Frankliniella occidentalis]
MEATRSNWTTRGTVASKDIFPVRGTKAPTSQSSTKSRDTPAPRTVRNTKGQVPRGSPKARSPRSTPASFDVLGTLGTQASFGNLTTRDSQASTGTPAYLAVLASRNTPKTETPSGNRPSRGTEVSSGNLTTLSTEAPRETRATDSSSASPGLLQGRSGLLDFLLGHRGHRAHRGHRKKLGHGDRPSLLGPLPLLPASTERPGRRRPPWLQLLCSAGEPTWLRVSSLLSQYLPDINARIRSRLFPTGIDNYRNPDFQKLVNAIPKIVAEDSEKVEVNADLLAWVVPYLEASGYYTYDGSLTTSPYSENVLWIVYENPIPIGKAQIAPFRAIENHESEQLTTNFRQLQNADGVEVRYVA